MRILLINPNNGSAIIANDASMFRSLVLDGWKPIGPNGKAAAAQILARLRAAEGQ